MARANFEAVFSDNVSSQIVALKEELRGFNSFCELGIDNLYENLIIADMRLHHMKKALSQMASTQRNIKESEFTSLQ